jgi:ABC-type glycerol-3-phosphate transport system substrate-binding protein
MTQMIPSGMSRRGLLKGAVVLAGAAAAGPLLAACTSKSTTGGGGTSTSDLAKILPKYIPNTSVTADIPGVAGASGAVADPVFLAYPSSPVVTVSSMAGKGGTYTTMTPLWGAIPPSSGNAYYETVNKALGATLKIQPSDGNNYGTQLPALFAADKLPDWIQIPGWNTNTLAFGDAVVAKFVDLSPYLAGDKISAYPNLANIPTGAWASGVWNGKLYGLPVYPSNASIAGTYFYRKDILAKYGISPDSIKTPADLAALGAQLTDAKAGQWAFDDLWAYLFQPFKFPGKWGLDASGKIFHKYETKEILDALDWHAKLAKAGYIHPDAIAGNNQNAKQRFWSGKVVVTADGPGAWNGDDAKSGTTAQPSYNRQAFKLLSVDGKPTIELGPGAGMFGYLNKKLSDAQIKECLSIANYLAAPYGSKEWLTVNFGSAGTDYNMANGNPILTDQGGKAVGSGFVQVAKDNAAWQADMVKHAVKPLFYAMNITEPAQYSSIGQAVEDTITDVRLGRKPVSAFQDAVKTWKSAGGDALRTFYEGIKDKYGTGQ